MVKLYYSLKLLLGLGSDGCQHHDIYILPYCEHSNKLLLQIDKQGDNVLLSSDQYQVNHTAIIEAEEETQY